LNAPEAVTDAYAIHQRWQRALASAGGPAVLVRLSTTDEQNAAARNEALILVLAQSRRPKPPPMSPVEIVRYSAARAVQLGFDAGLIWSKEQGRRSTDAEALKQARARIVLELRDHPATLADIGAVFAGRKKQSVADLEALGRKQRDIQKAAREEREQQGGK
jgi:hypothetical protein